MCVVTDGEEGGGGLCAAATTSKKVALKCMESDFILHPNRNIIISYLYGPNAAVCDLIDEIDGRAASKNACVQQQKKKSCMQLHQHG